jgi:hypothetical protein
LRGSLVVSFGWDSSVEAKSAAASAIGDTRGRADDGGAGGDVLDHDRSGAHHGIVANGDALKDDRTGTDPSPIRTGLISQPRPATGC